MEYGSEFDARANLAFTGSAGAFVQEDWQLYRSGRDAMKALARLLGPRRVLLPALCCESMIGPFTANGWEVGFYRMTADFRGDEADAREKLRAGDLLLVMPYFGIRPFSAAFLKSLRDEYIVEDRTQDIIVPRIKEDFHPHATLASLRKWAALPDGGMLQTALGAGEGVSDGRFAAWREEAMEKKSRYLESWEPAVKQDFLAELARASDLLDADAVPVFMGERSRACLRTLDAAAIYRARLKNVRRLAARLTPLRESGKLRFLGEDAENGPLYFPLLLEERGRVQRAMAEKGVYCPVIWPEPKEAAGVCPNAKYAVEHMLAIPCDQRYGEKDMDFIAACLTEVL